MAFYRIKQWGQYQHYKDRSPPWIKLHRAVLTSRTWVSASDSERVLAVACMLIAAETDNKIPSDAGYLQRVAYLNVPPDFEALVRLDFIEFIDDSGGALADASTALASGTKCSSEKRREETEKNITASATPARKVPRGTRGADPEWFLDFKLAYPDRAGDQGWRKALKAAHARMGEGHTPDEFIAGAKRYAAFCAATGKVGTEYTKQAATFLGPDKPFLLPWDAPQRNDRPAGRFGTA